VTTGANVTLNHLQVAGGFCANCGGGGISNDGILTVSRSLIENNVSGLTCTTIRCDDLYGGGIANDGVALLINSIIRDNYGFYGGGIHSRGTLSMTDSVIIGNKAFASGGGINTQGVLTISHTLFSANQARGGGAIDNFGIMNIAGSAFISNSANSGAMIGGAIANVGPMTITNSTFMGNRANTGGAILNLISAISPSRGTAYILNSTIAGNSATVGGGLAGEDFTVYNTIFTSNTSKNCDMGVDADSHSLDSGTSCQLSPGHGSISNTDPRLGYLLVTSSRDLVPTLPILLGSPAIEAGDDAVCPLTDQRGIPRPQGLHCDIGAYEAFNRYWWLPVIRK
jgi:predicted outer membrane repeat protein